MRYVVCVMGPTNCGKSTFIDKLCETDDRFTAVSVGKLLRAKYGADYFEGKANPAKTAGEALHTMIFSAIEAWKKNKIPVLDGQPRDWDQMEFIHRDWEENGVKVLYVHLYTSLAIRKDRSEARDTTEGEKSLTASRMVSDAAQLYDELQILSDRSARLYTLRSHSEETIKHSVADLIKFVNKASS